MTESTKMTESTNGVGRMDTLSVVLISPDDGRRQKLAEAVFEQQVTSSGEKKRPGESWFFVGQKVAQGSPRSPATSRSHSRKNRARTWCWWTSIWSWVTALWSSA